VSPDPLFWSALFRSQYELSVVVDAGSRSIPRITGIATLGSITLAGIKIPIAIAVAVTIAVAVAVAVAVTIAVTIAVAVAITVAITVAVAVTVTVTVSVRGIRG
jgi:hypothetical protein